MLERQQNRIFGIICAVKEILDSIQGCELFGGMKIDFADKCDKSEFDIPFVRQQLADYLCVERSALSAEISRLATNGVISSRKNHFLLNQQEVVRH